MSQPVLSKSFFLQPPEVCARKLIGATFRKGACAGAIVETEAYAAVGDEACHTFFRQKARTFVDQHEAGAGYVYLNYGMYWLANVLTKTKSGQIGFVLIRALEPVDGIGRMKRRRDRQKETDLCSGPGKLTIALAIDQQHHGVDFTTAKGPHFLKRSNRPRIIAGPRIGISREVERPWRFGIPGHPHLSKPFDRPIDKQFVE